VHYTYVLLSQRDGKWYIGATGDVQAGLKSHSAGRVPSTAPRRPLSLVYDEACLSADDAYRRERYLKSGRGGRYLRARLASSLASAGQTSWNGTSLARFTLPRHDTRSSLELGAA
jgi:putative endonuclease